MDDSNFKKIAPLKVIILFHPWVVMVTERIQWSVIIIPH